MSHRNMTISLILLITLYLSLLANTFTYPLIQKSTPTVSHSTHLTPNQLQPTSIPTTNFNHTESPNNLKKYSKAREHIYPICPKTSPTWKRNEKPPLLPIDKPGLQNTYQSTEEEDQAVTSTQAMTYWVDAGATGNGTKTNPAGNISYVLTNNISAHTYDTIKVYPGTYNHTVGESFPLHLNTSHLTLTSITNASPTIINGTDTTTGIKVTANNVTINGFTIKSYVGLHKSSDIMINNNTFQGICSQDSLTITIINNTVKNGRIGILASDSSVVTITNNIVTNNDGRGILLEHSTNTTLTNNTITHTDTGIELQFSNSITLASNSITHAGRGILLWNSTENVLLGNILYHCGIVLDGGEETFTSQVIATNNTINGKPIYYCKNQARAGERIQSDAGEIILGNVSGVTITNVNIRRGAVGILLGYSSHITITKNSISTGIGILSTNSNNTTIKANNFTYTFTSILFQDSNENTILENTFTNNSHGIGLYSSDNIVRNNLFLNNHQGVSLGGSNNTVKRNTFTNNEEGIFQIISGGDLIKGNLITNNKNGIHLRSSNNNTVIENIIANNTKYGLILGERSSGNFVYRNNIFGNEFMNAIDRGYTNMFNSSTIGNYWGDYTGSDEDDDGIGDVPYTIAGKGRSRDYLPAVAPFELPPSDKGLSPTSLALLGIAIGIVLSVEAVAVYLYKKKE